MNPADPIPDILRASIANKLEGTDAELHYAAIAARLIEMVDERDHRIADMRAAIDQADADYQALQAELAELRDCE